MDFTLESYYELVRSKNEEHDWVFSPSVCESGTTLTLSMQIEVFDHGGSKANLFLKLRASLQKACGTTLTQKRHPKMVLRMSFINLE